MENGGQSAAHQTLLEINNAIKKQIVASPDAVKIREIGVASGMMTLFQHGQELVQAGVTTVSEVLRAARSLEGV